MNAELLWSGLEGGWTLQMLWYIRISGTGPEKAIVPHPSRLTQLTPAPKAATEETVLSGDIGVVSRSG